MHEATIYHGDFYKICEEKFKDNSIDLIVTDPPYPKEFYMFGVNLEKPLREF